MNPTSTERKWRPVTPPEQPPQPSASPEASSRRWYAVPSLGKAATEDIAPSPARHEQRSRWFAATSFAEARNLPHGFDDSFMAKLHDKIVGSGFWSSRTLLNEVPFTASDDAFMRDPDAERRFNAQLDGLLSRWRQEKPDVTGTIRSTVADQGDFVIFDSDAFFNAAVASGTRPPADSRIYLNPAYAKTLDIFQEIIMNANAEGLSFRSKVAKLDVFPRGYAKWAQISGDSNPQMRPEARGDSIVLYAPSDQADELLHIVQQTWTAHEQDFADRQTAPVAYKLADGLAIGEEPAGSRESLTSHVGNVLDEAFQAVDTNLPEHEWRRSVTAHFAHLAATNDINPTNIAFRRNTPTK